MLGLGSIAFTESPLRAFNESPLRARAGDGEPPPFQAKIIQILGTDFNGTRHDIGIRDFDNLEWNTAEGMVRTDYPGGDGIWRPGGGATDIGGGSFIYRNGPPYTAPPPYWRMVRYKIRHALTGWILKTETSISGPTSQFSYVRPEFPNWPEGREVDFPASVPDPDHGYTLHTPIFNGSARLLYGNNSNWVGPFGPE
jgi:hypothetical protein